MGIWTSRLIREASHSFATARTAKPIGSSTIVVTAVAIARGTRTEAPSPLASQHQTEEPRPRTASGATNLGLQPALASLAPPNQISPHPIGSASGSV
jgi:hypothetical protein